MERKRPNHTIWIGLALCWFTELAFVNILTKRSYPEFILTDCLMAMPMSQDSLKAIREAEAKAKEIIESTKKINSDKVDSAKKKAENDIDEAKRTETASIDTLRQTAAKNSDMEIGRLRSEQETKTQGIRDNVAKNKGRAVDELVKAILLH